MLDLHLHHLENSRSFRILWLLEELGVEYQLTKYERTKSLLAPSTLKEIHPSGKSPILEVTGIDSENPEKTEALVESGHIIEFLIAKFDTEYTLHPKVDPDSAYWRDFNFWLHYAEASGMPFLVMRLLFAKVAEQSPTVIKPVAKSIRKQVESTFIEKNVSTVLGLVESKLAKDKWLAGNNFTAADIQMSFVIEAANSGKNLDRMRYVNTLNWLKLCKSRPAYKAAVEKGGALEF